MWPVTLLALLAAILIVIEVQTEADIVSILWLIVGIATLVTSIGAPLSVARDLSDEHIRERCRRRFLLRLTAVGFGLNVAQMLLIGLLVDGLLRAR